MHLCIFSCWMFSQDRQHTNERMSTFWALLYSGSSTRCCNSAVHQQAFDPELLPLCVTELQGYMKSRTPCTLKELTTSETLSCASEDSKHFARVWASNSRFTDTHLAVWWQIVKPDLEKQKSFPWQGLHLHSLWMCSELSFRTVGLEQKLTVCFGPCLGAPHCLEVRGPGQALMQNSGRLWKQLSMSSFWSMQECLFPKSCP